MALFYRKRHFPIALVFAVHLHAFAFVVFAIYALKAFRAVYGGGWPTTIAKAGAIGFLYLIASIPAFIAIILCASFT